MTDPDTTWEESRRLRRIVLPQGLLAGLLTGRARLELPSDARIRRVGFAWEHDAVYVLVWSAAYDPVPEGFMIPLDIELRVTPDPTLGDQRSILIDHGRP